MHVNGGEIEMNPRHYLEVTMHRRKIKFDCSRYQGESSSDRYR
jgi:hypothetical protein